jgi:3-oxoacyl-[acyl-carrier protein] reductase
MKYPLKALICGASQGIGEACAKEFASRGISVVLLARSQDKLESICKSLPGSDHEILAHDLGDITGLKTKLSQILKKGPIQILINNSGGPKAGPLMQAEDSEFLKALSEHVLVSQNLVKMLLPGMRDSEYGRVINIISTSVKVPIQNLGVSNTIRAAMGNWAKTLATELGPLGITVNNVLPGYTETPRLEALKKAAAEKQNVSLEQIEKQWLSTIPLGRFAKASETAKAVAFLASADASYISGINLPVDGGRTPCL